MARYTFKDIEEFLLDDDFFQWAKYGSSNNGFDIEVYKRQHPGSEERIELAITIIRSTKVVENALPTSQEYKMQSFDRMMHKLHSQVTSLKTKTEGKVIQVTGTVRDIQATSLGGVKIQSADSKENVMTHYRGTYTIKAKDNGRLTFSKKGFVSRTVEVEGQADVSIQMAKGE